MNLLLLLNILSCTVGFSGWIAIPLKNYLTKPSNKEEEITDEIKKLRSELLNISLHNQYTNYIKLERRIVALETNQKTIEEQKCFRNLCITHGTKYVIQVLLTLILSITVAFYRKEVLIVFDESYEFVPFTGILAYPTGIKGTISVPFIALASYVTFQTMANLFEL